MDQSGDRTGTTNWTVNSDSLFAGTNILALTGQ
jgi:hypothetical protein